METKGTDDQKTALLHLFDAVSGRLALSKGFEALYDEYKEVSCVISKVIPQYYLEVTRGASPWRLNARLYKNTTQAENGDHWKLLTNLEMEVSRMNPREGLEQLESMRKSVVNTLMEKLGFQEMEDLLRYQNEGNRPTAEEKRKAGTTLQF